MIDNILRLLDTKEGFCERITVYMEDVVHSTIRVSASGESMISSRKIKGLRITAHNGRLVGHVTVNGISKSNVEKAIEKAIRLAKGERSIDPPNKAKALRGCFEIKPEFHPAEVAMEDKIRSLSSMAKEVKNVGQKVKVYALYKEIFGQIRIISSDGTNVTLKPVIIGLLLAAKLKSRENSIPR